MKFFYKGVSEGKSLTGIIEAASYDEALLLLYDKGIDVEDLRQASAFDELSNLINQFRVKFGRVKLEDLIVFTRQFATLFDAGVPISTILERLSEQTVSFKLKGVVEQIKKDVDGGMSLSEAFARREDIFSPLYINMLKVGEESGTLDVVLERLATILETELQTRNRIKTATRYPKIVVSAIVIAFSIIITFVIPRFVSLFNKFNATLPLPTRILIGINNFVHNFWWLVIGLIIASIAFFKKYKKTPQGKRKIDEIILKLPILGKLVHKIYLSRIMRILGLLYKSGLAITTSLDIVAEATGNDVAKQAILAIRSYVESGATISRPIKSSEFFPDIVSDMVAVGEETGRLDEMLFKVSDYFDEEISYAINNLSTAIEPILLVFIAAMVLLLALGVFLPMWDMVKVVH
ncbi:type II secretion system F family protein [Hippea maritima]|uniref:Type II secretion system F domain protein n=1 Tax=Hippea maritima (strain ATCC 700847 / DSM 10411 / MH2) TaxID=760142 RepID=F2LWI8_HIPMA|nr:type II secretion system F family protein [Hippea maritima]AEA34097.1 Type II secretion system F domain protein [Hippea maritima DSM 10411]